MRASCQPSNMLKYRNWWTKKESSLELEFLPRLLKRRRVLSLLLCLGCVFVFPFSHCFNDRNFLVIGLIRGCGFSFWGYRVIFFSVCCISTASPHSWLTLGKSVMDNGSIISEYLQCHDALCTSDMQPWSHIMVCF